MKTLLLSYSAYSYVLSVGIHTALLLGLGWSFTQEAQFGVRQEHDGGMQVEWVSADSPANLPLTSRAKTDDTTTEEEPLPDISLPEESLSESSISISQASPSLPRQSLSSQVTATNPSLFSSLPSRSAAAPLKNTASKPPEESGPIIRAQPHYLKNPPPIYPNAARERKQQGLVILSVIIGVDGNPLQIALVSSSGYTLLDEAARKAVSRWQFKPAKMGNVCVQSKADIPIRFELK